MCIPVGDGAARHRAGRNVGEVAASGGPMGTGPMPWEGAGMYARLQNGQVADWEDWYDLGTVALHGAVDQTWGRYTLAARSLVTALRLKQGLPAAHYHLGFALQKLRENCGGDWQWKAWNSFTLSTRGKTEIAFEGLAWFHIENGNSQAAFQTYDRGLGALCSPAAGGRERQCNVSPEFVYRWWDALQQACNFDKWHEAIGVLHNLLESAMQAAPSSHTMSMAQAMRTPMHDLLRRQIAEAEWTKMASTTTAAAEAAAAPAAVAKEAGMAERTLPQQWLYSEPFALDQVQRTRVRLAYLSFNFSPSRNLNGLVAGLLQRHDRRRFHVTSFAIYGHHGRDSEAERRAAVECSDEWVDLQQDAASGGGLVSDAEMASAINRRRIHVLVDLVGLIRNHRHGILVLRPAPLQASTQTSHLPATHPSLLLRQLSLLPPL